MKKNLSFVLILLSLLFNIQVGFTHDIEHPYHDNEQTEDLHHDSDHHHDDVQNNNLIECEDCTFTVTDHSAKTTNLSADFDFSFNQTFQINEHPYHDNEHTEDSHHDSDHHHDDVQNNNLIECEDCTFTVTDHSVKTTNLSSDFVFSFNQTFQINDNYLVRDSFSLGIVAYQSRAP